MPPTTQEVMVTPYKVDCVDKNMLSVQIIQHIVEFIYADRFGLWESDLWSFVVDVGYPWMGKS